MTPAQLLGKKIKELRTKRNLSQQQLANLAFVTRKAVGNWENGQRTPDAEMTKRLADALGVDVLVLLEAMHERHRPSEGLRNIIIVENEPEILIFLVRELTIILPDEQIWGFLRPNEALLFSESNPICIAFLDIHLDASGNGIDLARSLMESHPQINIIFVTGHTEYALDAWQLNASGYVIKPVDRETLVTQLSVLRYPVSNIRVNPSDENANE